MKNQPKVSVIMPSLNVVEYIKECIESVVNQTLKEIEIICIDAGSTDGTLEILREYEKKDERITVIVSDKKSYGYQMNIGIDNATGEYFGIVETDDYVELDMYEELYTKANELDVEIVRSNYRIFLGNDFDRKFTNKQIIHTKQFNNIVNSKSNANIVFGADMLTQTGIYSLNMIKKHKIKYNESLGASYQDQGFWFQVCCLAEKIYYLNEYFYNLRRDNPNSSVHDTSKIYCICDEYDFIRNWLKKNPNLEKQYKYLCAFFRNGNYWYTLSRILDRDKKDFFLRFAKDFEKIKDSGELDKKLYQENNYNNTLRVIENPMFFFNLLNIKVDDTQQKENISVELEEINICFIAEEKNTKSLSVSLVSMMENANKSTKYNIYILYFEDFSKKTINLIIEFTNKYNCNIITKKVYKVNKADYIEISKLIVDNLNDVDKCIYLYYNTVIQKDLSQLYISNLFNNSIAGVRQIDDEINSSVLLIDCAKVRENDIKIGELDLKFNLQAYLLKGEKSFNFGKQVEIKGDLVAKFDKKQLKSALRENFVFSYTDECNPFNSGNCSLVDVWYEYFDLSPITNQRDIKTPLISVIVPVYNVEQYLELCVDSITNQSYKNLEIILVDDGSTDSSGQMCYDLCKLDSRICVIHKPNGGLSSARNYGMDIAKGEYISFIDSDDFIHPKTYEIAMNCFNKNDLDLVEWEYKTTEENDIKYIDINFEKITRNKFDVTDNEDYIKANINYKKHYHLAWNKLFKLELIKDKRFEVGKYHEDVFFGNEYLLNVKRAGYISDKLYYYVQRKGSIVNHEISMRNVDGNEGLYHRHMLLKKYKPHFIEADLQYALTYGYRRINSIVSQRNDQDKSIRIAIMDILLKYYDHVMEFDGISQNIKDDFILANNDVIGFIDKHEESYYNELYGKNQRYNYTIHSVNSVYQLLNTINYRVNVANEKEQADLILSDHVAVLAEFYDKLVESKLFNNIYLVPTLNICSINILLPENLKIMYKSNEIINSVSKLDINKYDNMFCTNFDLFERMLFTANNTMSVRYIEDGLSVYYRPMYKIYKIFETVELYTNIQDSIVASYSYNPKLYSHNVNYKKNKLPKIDKYDEKLKNILNKIFKIKLPITLPKYIFLEQYFEEINVKCDDFELIEILSNEVGRENLYIKTHPRFPKNRTKHLSTTNITEYNCPFEVLLMNIDISEHVFITVDSTAVSSVNLIFEEDAPVIYLYNLVNLENRGHITCGKFIDHYANISNYKNIMIPKSIEEYKEILSKFN